jgi:cyclin-dependent kinase 12/13
MENDLSRIISSLRPKQLSLQIIKCYMRQILETLCEIHRRGILHLDLKPANILVNGNGRLCLADLGFMTDATPPLNNNVVTRWYRPPEILLGSTSYGSSADMWGVGCIFYELLTGYPAFPGKDDEHQLQVILDLCGSEILHGEHSNNLKRLPHFFEAAAKYQFTSSKLEKKISWLPNEARDLLCQFLSVDPDKRISAEDAFEHDFFYTGVLPFQEGYVPPALPSMHEHELFNENHRGLWKSLCFVQSRES